MKIVTISEMRSIEVDADKNGLSFTQMMENAGRGLADQVIHLTNLQGKDEDVQVLGLVGPGNNGGDTLVALERLAEKGWIVRAYFVNRKPGKDDLAKRFEAAGGEIYLDESDTGYQTLQAFLETADVLLDGILGIGVKLPLRGDIQGFLSVTQALILKMEHPPYVIAVDCPSGVDCDTGEMASEVIPADTTVTMAAVKRGLMKIPAYGVTGELRVVSIGDLESMKSWQGINNHVAYADRVASLLPVRNMDSHKGTFGTTVIVAGCTNYPGAALLAGKAAYRSGAGLVTLAVPNSLHAAIAGHLPEATWILLPHEQGVIASNASDVLCQNLDKATALLLGPGWGLEDTTKEFLRSLLTFSGVVPIQGRLGFLPKKGTEQVAKHVDLPPLIVDADGLKLLSRLDDWTKLLKPQSILTPHPGEMSIMTGLSVDVIQKHRLEVAKKFAIDWGQIIVLKGAFTIIASPDGSTTTIPVATSSLAKAGTGDVLAGIIAGLRGQGMDAYPAAVSGAWIHAHAGLSAAQVLGDSSVLALDVADSIPDVIKSL